MSISYITLNKKNQTHKLFYKGHSSFLRENKKFKNLFDEMVTKENISFDSLDITLPIENILKTRDYFILKVRMGRAFREGGANTYLYLYK